MPDIRGRTPLRSRAVNAWWRIYWWGIWSTELAGAGMIAMTAGALAALHVDLQYVVGGLLVVYGRKLATKRISMPSVKEPQPEAARPVREMLARMGDKRANTLDVDISP